MLDLKCRVGFAPRLSLREWGAGAVGVPPGFGKGVAMAAGPPGPDVRQYVEHRWLGAEG